MRRDPASKPILSAPAVLETQLRLQYSMTIVRLVNGVSDSSQKGRAAMSVANLAQDAGVKLNVQLAALLYALAL